MHKVTIEDISRHTGLSRGTVSRALNDRPDISQQTKERVLEACRELHYSPSHAARSLATGRRYAVAILVDDLQSVFASAFARGVIARAQIEHYAVHVSELGAEPDRALEHLRALVSERVDSLLLATPLRPDLAQRVAEFMNERPLVTVAAIPGFECDVLTPDYAEAGRLAARHVLPGAAPDVIYVHQDDSEAGALRRAGFEEVCRAGGLDPAQVTIEVPRPHAGQMDRLAAVRPRLGHVRALAASDDFLALELMLLCAQAGRTPGRDVAILGQGNEVVGTLISPTLTTTDYCGTEIGQRALDVALQRVMKTRQDAPQQAVVPPILIPRETTRLLQ
jgi:DNA-binding LacI/PurR family transcriptional regulator